MGGKNKVSNSLTVHSIYDSFSTRTLQFLQNSRGVLNYVEIWETVNDKLKYALVFSL